MLKKQMADILMKKASKYIFLNLDHQDLAVARQGEPLLKGMYPMSGSI